MLLSRHRFHLLIALLLALDVTAFARHRIVTLLMIAIALNAIACGWVVLESFRYGKHKIPASEKAIIFFMLIVLNLLVFSGAYMRLQQSRMPFVTLSQPASAFTWRAFDGTVHGSGELAGKVVVLHFWATWCGPCRKEFPKLAAFAHTQSLGIVFLTISSDTEETKPEAFLRSIHEDVHLQSPPNLLFAWDGNNHIAEDIFHNLSYPATIVIDKSGHMRRKYMASVDWGNPAVASYIHTLEAMP